MASSRKGTTAPTISPGQADETGADHLAALELAPLKRRFWRAKAGRQCLIGASRSDVVSSLAIAVDGHAGSNSSGDLEASWGFVVARPSPVVLMGATPSASPSPLQLQEFYGPVITDSDLSMFWGASKLSNNTAELSALIAVTKWLLVSGLPAQHVDILFDSMWASKSICRLWKPKVNALLVSTAQRSLEVATDAGFSFSWYHCKAHRGHFMNEAADAAALKGAAATVAW